MKRINLILFFSLLCSIVWGQKQTENLRSRIDLRGTWQSDFGMLELPGTTDTNRKGNENHNRNETTHLSRHYSYVGKVLYTKEVDIPKGWKGKHIILTLERTKPTQIWIDEKYVGANDNISTSQVYDLTRLLSPGKHKIVIQVDNGESVPPQLLQSSHAYTESTQTNWNGIIGEMYLEARSQVHIEDVQVYPDAKRKTINVKLKIASPEKIKKGSKLTLQANAWNSAVNHRVEAVEYSLSDSQGEYEFDYPLGEEALLWSEFHPALYRLEVKLKNYDSRTVDFGLRDFKTQGTQFSINGNITFLRGKHDACVFPLTAHTAMDVDTWRHYFRVAKSYGINHYRFHSWCPPKACFEAADIEGIYLQPELPFWGTLTKEEEYLASFLKKEGIHIQREYGNHASFVMFAIGNELFGDQEVMDDLIASFRAVDSDRHLYAFGSNNFLGWRGQIPGEDFQTTCRIGGEMPNAFNTHTRGSFSFTDAYDGGYINHTYPNTVMNYSSAIVNCNVPVISHENGQFQVYPNYDEIQKYTGVLYPYNMEVFRKRLEEAGMLDQAHDFFLASGKWSAELYRADIEMSLRTSGFGGFQLLDLQDYPGQGSAYVGMLDAFMDSKGLITPEKWSEFCREIVPLLMVEKFCWTNTETLKAEVKIANYSETSLEGKDVEWTLKDQQGVLFDQGIMKIRSGQAGLIEVGEIHSAMAAISKAERLNLELQIVGTSYRNSYPLWIYPEAEKCVSEAVIVTDLLSLDVIDKLKRGEKVLWFPKQEQYEKQTVGGLFQTDYWNYRMFKNISESNNRPVSPGTLGILTDPKHPIFNSFPTDYHTNWQWFSIIKESCPLILDRLPTGYKPIVQVIDNVERNYKLGLIFEFTVEKGKLLICMSDLFAVMDKPEVKQLYNSMLQYMLSDEFTPLTRLDIDSLFDLFNSEVETNKIEVLRNISYD